MGEGKKWNVMVVEDDAQSQAHLLGAIHGHEQLALVGAFDRVAESLVFMAATEQRVDALVCDLGLPDGNGMDVIRFAVQRWPHCDCMVYSMFGDDAHVLASIAVGAVGYIHKDAVGEDISQAILDLKAGAAPMSPNIARSMLALLRPTARLELTRSTPEPKPPNDLSAHLQAVLSAREMAVLNLIAKGFSYVEIANLHCVSVNTVKAQIKKIYQKLAVTSKTEAVFEGTRLGLIHAE